MRTLATIAALALSACVGPTTVLRTVDTRPAIAVQGAPSGALLVVDGNAVGSADQYDGNPNILRLEPGTHEVEIRDPSGGSVLFKERVFVESELKTIQVR